MHAYIHTYMHAYEAQVTMILRIDGECYLKQHLSESVASRPHTKFVFSDEYGKPREPLVFVSQPEPGT